MNQGDTFGDVDNGERIQVQFPGYSGRAGVRSREAGREVAYIGEPPRLFPVTGMIADESVIATARIPSKIGGFVVLWVPNP